MIAPTATTPQKALAIKLASAEKHMVYLYVVFGNAVASLIRQEGRCGTSRRAGRVGRCMG
ncbi:hypothetical protein CCP4SC76_6610007 [Gammaproteobacteria bacterium]